MKLKYQGKDIDLVELVLLIWVSGKFYADEKPATQEQIRQAIESIIDVDLDNFSIRGGELKKRKITLKALTEWMRKLQAHLGRPTIDRSQPKRYGY
jgi:hypothetical protein